MNEQLDKWSRQEARYQCGYDSPERHTYSEALRHALTLIVSDEAVQAAAQVLSGLFEPDAGELHETRLMLEAALEAITKDKT